MPRPHPLVRPPLEMQGIHAHEKMLNYSSSLFFFSHGQPRGTSGTALRREKVSFSQSYRAYEHEYILYRIQKMAIAGGKSFILCF